MDAVVVGDRYFVSVFRLAGIETLEVENEDSEVSKVEELVNEGKCKILFVREKIAVMLGKLREDLLKERKFYPILVVVPDFSGSLGKRKKELTQFVNKSVGVKLKAGD